MKIPGNEGIPQKYQDMVGTKATFGSYLFGQSKDLPMKEYNILDIRWGSGVVFDMKKITPKHPSMQFKLKREGMKVAQWTQGFAVREIGREIGRGIG